MTRHIVRKYIVLVFIIGIFALIITRVLSGTYNVVSMVGATLPYHIINLFLVTLALIDWQGSLSVRKNIRILLSIVGLLIIIGFFGGIRIGLGLSIWYIGYLLYIRSNYASLTNSRIISLWSVARSGLSMIAMMLAFGYTFIFLSYQKPLDFDCNNLSQQTIGLLTTYFPAKIASNTGTISLLSDKIEFFKTKTLGQIIGIQQTGGLYDTIDMVQSGSIDTGTILGIIENYKKVFIDDFLSNKSTIDRGVCEFTLDHIKNLSSNSTVQVSVIVLLGLLLSVFTGGLLLICGIVYFIVLYILYRIGIYSIHKKTGSHEVIQ